MNRLDRSIYWYIESILKSTPVSREIILWLYSISHVVMCVCHWTRKVLSCKTLFYIVLFVRGTANLFALLKHVSNGKPNNFRYLPSQYKTLKKPNQITLPTDNITAKLSMDQYFPNSTHTHAYTQHKKNINGVFPKYQHIWWE